MSGNTIQFYDKKTCGTCRKAKTYLDQLKMDYDLIDITKKTPPREILEKHINESGLKQYLNSRSTIYREKGFSKNLPSKAEAIDLMMEHPDLIKRPVIIQGDRVLFGFDEGKIDELDK